MAIPSSYLADVIPGVLATGVSADSLYAMMLSQNTSIPAGSASPFYTADSVGALLGYDSPEYACASTYFSGPVNSARKPSVLYISRLATAKEAASLIGAKLPVTLAQLKALTGSLTITVDGTVHTITPNFSAVTSFSDAASIMQTAIGTGTVTYNSGTGGFIVTGSSGATEYTVSSVAVGAGGTGYAVGDTVTFAGGKGTISTIGTGGAVTGLTLQSTTPQTTNPAGTGLTTTTSGGGTGLTVTTTSTSTNAGVPDASSVSYATGTLADSLGLSVSAGAMQSLAILDVTVAAQMDVIRSANGVWSHFFCAFDPANQKTDLAAWTSAKTDNTGAILHDTAVTVSQITAGTSWGQTITAGDYEGVGVVAFDADTAALIASAPCSVDWSAANGRYNVAFRRSASLSPTVTDLTTATALEGAGYNFYGQFAGSGVSYNGIYPGAVSGKYMWLDSFFNQIWMRRNFQLDLMNLLFNKGQIPYNTQGDGYIAAALKRTIDAALNFGAIRAGVVLSDEQTQTLVNTYGQAAAQAVQMHGYYLYTNAAGTPATTRGKRQTPEVDFYYTDGQSVQRIRMNSIMVA